MDREIVKGASNRSADQPEVASDPDRLIDLRSAAPAGPPWFQQAFAHAPTGVAVVNRTGTIALVNQAFTDAFGGAGAGVVGTRLCAHRLDEPTDGDALPTLTRAATDQYVRANGSLFWGRVSTTPIADGGDETLIHLEDVTAEVEATAQLAELALRDSLTGLPNRAVLLEVFSGAAARSRRSSARLAVLFVDLDHFKEVNDSCGHAAGDDALVEVSRRLKQRVREGDLVVRFGGDEFVILLEHLPTDMAAARYEAQAVGERLVQALSEPVHHGDHDHQIGASVGAAVADGATDLDVLIRHADTAAYRAKAGGRGRVEVFDDLELAETLHLAARHAEPITITTAVRTRLRAVLDATGAQAGVEVLVDAGPVPAGIDERVRHIGRFAIDMPAILRAAAIAARDHPVVHLAIPPAVFREIAVDVIVLDECARAGADPARLALSVAAVSLADGTADLIELRALAERGAKIGIGDFGVQSANIVDVLRPFVSFVRMRTAEADDPNNPAHQAHLLAISSLVTTLGLTITAHRVDDRETAAAWIALGATSLCGTVDAGALRTAIS